jgi:hypothetical protein
LRRKKWIPPSGPRRSYTRTLVTQKHRSPNIQAPRPLHAPGYRQPTRYAPQMTDGHRDPESPARGQTFPPPRPSTRTRTCVATPQSTHAREPALTSMAALPWLARAARPPCQAATASSHRVAQRAPVARGPPRVPFPRTHSSLFPLPCVLSLHSHPNHTHPRPPATQTRCPLDQHPESRSIWTCGLDPGVRRSAPAGPRAHAHAHMHTPADVIRCLPYPALPCLLAAIATGTGHGAIFFSFFFFLPFLVWLGRCVNAVGERIGAVLARVGKQVVRGC